MEDKQLICNLLCETLQATRNQYDLVALNYNNEKETVTVIWQSGGKKVVNVAMDSGTAMIRDIMKSIN